MSQPAKVLNLNASNHGRMVKPLPSNCSKNFRVRTGGVAPTSRQSGVCAWETHSPRRAPGGQGKFQVLVAGKPLAEAFGTRSDAWFWHDGGTVEITKKKTALALHDLTGFDGRCDAIYFTSDLAETPPNDNAPLSAWRKE